MVIPVAVDAAACPDDPDDIIFPECAQAAADYTAGLVASGQTGTAPGGTVGNFWRAKPGQFPRAPKPAGSAARASAYFDNSRIGLVH